MAVYDKGLGGVQRFVTSQTLFLSLVAERAFSANSRRTSINPPNLEKALTLFLTINNEVSKVTIFYVYYYKAI